MRFCFEVVERCILIFSWIFNYRLCIVNEETNHVHVYITATEQLWTIRIVDDVIWKRRNVPLNQKTYICYLNNQIISRSIPQIVEWWQRHLCIGKIFDWRGYSETMHIILLFLFWYFCNFITKPFYFVNKINALILPIRAFNSRNYSLSVSSVSLSVLSQ